MPDLTLAAAVAVPAVVGAGVAVARHQPDSVVALELRFPPDFSREQAEMVLSTIAGLPKRSRVSVVAEGQNGQLRLWLVGGSRALGALRPSIQGFAPALRVDDATVPVVRERPARRAVFGWHGRYVLLRDDQPEVVAAAVLGALRHATSRERVRLLVKLRPVSRPKVPRLPDRGEPDLLREWLDPDADLPTDELRQVRRQYASGPPLNVRMEVHVWAGSDGRARHLLHQLAAVLRTRNGARGRLWFRSHPLAWNGVGTTLSVREVVGLVGWPLNGPVVPGVAYVRAPALLPDRAIPSRKGRLFGSSTWPGMGDRQLRQPAVGALSHTAILGPSGAGKSTLVTGLMLDDLRAGRGLMLVDLKGDTADDLLERIPENRLPDVVVLDPSDGRPLPGLKAIDDGNPELAADLWVGLFRQLFADSWGVRTERYLRLGVHTLSLSPSSVITDLPRVFSDVALRRRLLARGAPSWLIGSWAAFDALSPAQRSEHLAAPLGKAQDLLGRGPIRAVLAQTQPRTTIARAMETNRIVVVRLPPALIGDATAQVLGGLTLYEIYQAVLARIRRSKAHRSPFAVYVDEPAVMRFLPIPLDALFELARGLGVGVTVATQSLHRLPDAVRLALLANAATLVTFRASYQDALIVARELPGVTAEQVQYLEQYEIVARIGLDHGRVAAPATARTQPLAPPSIDPDHVRQVAAERYGGLPEADTNTQHDEPSAEVGDAPIGSRRRPS